MKSLVLIYFLLISTLVSYGQKTRVNVRVVKVYSETNSEDGPEEFAWKTWIDGQDERCKYLSGEPDWYDVSYNEATKLSKVYEGQISKIPVRLQAWENDCHNGDAGQYCVYNTDCKNGDDDYIDETVYIETSQLPDAPGKESFITLSYRGGHYKIQVEVYYSPQPPTSIDVIGGQKVCGGQTYTLHANSQYPDANLFGWEEYINGEWIQYVYNITWGPDLQKVAPLNAPKDGFIRKQYRVRMSVGRSTSEDYAYVFVDIYPPPPTGTIKNIKNVTCFNGSDGSITINSVKGGSGNFTFYLQKENGAPSPNQTGSKASFNGLKEGKYTLSVEDNGVCRFDTAFTITQPSKLITTEVTRSNYNGYNISCFNLSNGSFKALASGGIPGYKYAMTNNPLVLTSYVYSNDGSFDLLKAGDYIVISVDKNNCKSEPLKISLSQPNGITLTTNTTNVICRDQKTGSISLVGGQGAGSFKYSIDGGKTFLASNTFNNLSAGTYTAVVKDVNECQLQKQIIISQPDTKLNLSIVKIDSVSCYGNFDGKIQVKGEGGVAPYLYSINSGLERSDYIFFGLNAGKQTLSLKDKLGCKVSLEAIVKQPDSIRITPIVKNVSCLGLNNGSIEVLVSGGKKPYKYEWEDRKESTNKLTMLSPDIYNITVRDASCSAVKAIEVTQPKDPLILNFKNKKNSICNGRCTGEILLEASGGTLPYSFTWNGDTIKKHPLVKDICKGDYSAEVIDSRGCQSIKKVNIEDSIEFKWQNLNQIIICPGQILSLDATNTSSSYSWYSENGFSSTGPKANIVSPGKYHLLIINNYGCYLKDTFDIKVSKDVLKAKFLLPSMVPLGDTVAFAEVSKPEPDSVHWRFTNNPIIVDSSSLIPKLIYSAPGVYTVKMTAYLGECIDSVEKTITFYIPEDGDVDSLNLGFNKVTKFLLYPNPNEGIFKVEVSLSGEDQIFIGVYDQQGRTKTFVSDSGKDNYIKDFELPQLPSGSYVLKLQTSSESKSMHFIVK